MQKTCLLRDSGEMTPFIITPMCVPFLSHHNWNHHTMAHGVQSEMVRSMQCVTCGKYRRTICIHQPRSCVHGCPTWLIENTRPSQPLGVSSRPKWRLWAAVTVSWPQCHWDTLGRSETYSSCETRQDPTIYRTEGLIHNCHKRLPAVIDAKGYNAYY